MSIVAGTLVALFGLVGVVVTLLGFSGVWLTIVVALLVEWWRPGEQFGLWTILGTIGLGVLGEVAEFGEEREHVGHRKPRRSGSQDGASEKYPLDRYLDPSLVGHVAHGAGNVDHSSAAGSPSHAGHEHNAYFALGPPIFSSLVPFE